MWRKVLKINFGNFEKVGNLPISLPRNDGPISTNAGDVILYQGNKFVIYYDHNEWNFFPNRVNNKRVV